MHLGHARIPFRHAGSRPLRGLHTFSPRMCTIRFQVSYRPHTLGNHSPFQDRENLRRIEHGAFLESKRDHLPQLPLERHH